MKTVLVTLALCFVISQASVARPNNYEIQVEDVINEITRIAIDAAHTLENQLEEIVLEPLHQVDEAVQRIDDRREENEDCVEAQQAVVVKVVDNMHDEMNVCGASAAKTSADIVVNINKASQQLIFDGYDVAKTYRKCRRYKNSVLKKSCYTRLTIKATLYLKNARRSIKTINDSVNNRIPAVITEGDRCTHTASDKAVYELDNIYSTIEACIVAKNN